MADGNAASRRGRKLSRITVSHPRLAGPSAHAQALRQRQGPASRKGGLLGWCGDDEGARRRPLTTRGVARVQRRSPTTATVDRHLCAGGSGREDRVGHGQGRDRGGDAAVSQQRRGRVSEVRASTALGLLGPRLARGVAVRHQPRSELEGSRHLQRRLNHPGRIHITRPVPGRILLEYLRRAPAQLHLAVVHRVQEHHVDDVALLQAAARAREFATARSTTPFACLPAFPP